MKKTLLFDLDGTLLDTLLDLTNAINHMLKHFNHTERSAAEIRQFLGNGAIELVKKAIDQPLTDAEFEKRYRFYSDYYEKNSMVHTKPYEGIMAMLDELKARGYKMAVISNKQDEAVQVLVKDLFGGYFEYARGVKSDGIKKPDPRIIDSVLENMNASKSDAFLIGDSEVDIKTGKDAQIEVIACLWGFRDMKDIAPLKPEFIIGKPMDLLKVI